jgi:hypothetical protein
MFDARSARDRRSTFKFASVTLPVTETQGNRREALVFRDCQTSRGIKAT